MKVDSVSWMHDGTLMGNRTMSRHDWAGVRHLVKYCGVYDDNDALSAYGFVAERSEG